jgi:hypothetical protein
VVGVAVPESGYAGEGAVEAVEREDRMPERIAMPSVPIGLYQSRTAWKCSSRSYRSREL